MKSETGEKRDGASPPASVPAPSPAQTDTAAKPPAEKASSDSTAMPTCSAKDDVEHAGRTGVEGAKTGVLTGVEGVKTFGKATAGLFQGGSDEAARRWNEGKEQTKATAREGANKTREEANAPPCK